MNVKSYKTSLTDPFYFTAFRFALTTPYFIRKLKIYNKFLKKKSYLTGTIEHSIKYFLNKLYVPRKVIAAVRKKETFIKLPYLGMKVKNLPQTFVATK